MRSFPKSIGPPQAWSTSNPGSGNSASFGMIKYPLTRNQGVVLNSTSSRMISPVSSRFRVTAFRETVPVS